MSPTNEPGRGHCGDRILLVNSCVRASSTADLAEIKARFHRQRRFAWRPPATSPRFRACFGHPENGFLPPHSERLHLTARCAYGPVRAPRPGSAELRGGHPFLDDIFISVSPAPAGLPELHPPAEELVRDPQYRWS